MGSVIAMLSGKGGTGKTTACAGISIALASAGDRVLCVDCDVGLRNLDISLGLADSNALSFQDVSEGGYPLEQAAIHPDCPNLRFLTAPMNRRVDQIDEEAFRCLIRSARTQFDYILLDAPAGLDAGFQLCATHADRIILVTNPEPSAIRDAARTGQQLELMKKNQVRIIVNRVKRKLLEVTKRTIDDVMDESGLPLLGVVPEDENVTLAAAFGKPLLHYSRRGGAAQACRRIAKRIQGMHVPLPNK